MKNRLDKIEKPKRKFRAMTEYEICIKTKFKQKCPLYDDYVCSYFDALLCGSNIAKKQKQMNTLYKTKDGKYILIEVKK